jgi:transcriptional regulator with XRE-family HTH domain
MPTMEAVRVNGNKLRKLREQKLLTREELGERAGVSADQIGRIERGVTTNPHMRTIRGLVKALEVGPTELLED